MGKRKTKTTATLSDQLREIIETCELSRYEIAKRSKVDASQLHRFLHGTGRLTTDSLDRIGAVLRLRFTEEW
jgi:transcriptional regulator with XRE-family HTH domain